MLGRRSPPREMNKSASALAAGWRSARRSDDDGSGGAVTEMFHAFQAQPYRGWVKEHAGRDEEQRAGEADVVFGIWTW